MRVLRGAPSGWPDDLGPCAISIGVFDGVHLGHQAVLASLRRRAVELGGLTTALVTFDPHPLTVVAPERAPVLITELPDRLALLALTGLDVAAVLDFDDDLRTMGAAEFSEEILAGGLSARLVAVGEDFRFGRNREGDLDALRRLGDHHGFEVDVIELVATGGRTVSSSAIRAALAAGEVEAAAADLGRAFELSGVVVEGDRRGAGLGFPTANLAVSPGLAVPGRGVYAAFARVEEERHPAVVNIGVRPTFAGSRLVVEAHLLDFAGHLYGRRLTLAFVSRLRDERRFAGVDDLVAQIGRDVAAAAELLAGADQAP